MPGGGISVLPETLFVHGRDPASHRPLFPMRIPSLSASRVFVVFMALVCLCSGGSLLQAQGAGSVEGRVINLANGEALGNARLRIEGTTLEVLTDASGQYRFPSVPAGAVAVTVSYSGFETTTQRTQVTPGQVVSLDYSLPLLNLAGERITLEQFTVTENALTAEALAINEQRVADNLKNVVAFEEFGNMGEGNPGEFLKYVPGVSVTFGPAIALEATVRGMPPIGTLVLEEGNEIASSNGDRNFELTGAATGNIERIEVTKSPTPDMPANAIGGSINIIGKSGFSSRKPELTYSVYYTVNDLKDYPNSKRFTFDRRIANTGGASARPIQPGIDLTYKLPVNKKFALTASASASKRYYNMDYNTTTWNHNRLALVSYVKNNTIQLYDKKLLSLAADWRVTKEGTLRAKVQYSSEDSYTTQSSFTTNFNTNVVGDRDSSQTTGATGVMTPGAAAFNFYRTTVNSSVSYVHAGDVWRIDGSISRSESGRERKDMDDGFFNTATQSNPTLLMSATDLSGIHDGIVPRLVATKAGAAINPYDAGALPVTQTSSTTLDVDSKLTSLRLNAGRSIDARFPLSFKVGGSVSRNDIDMTGETKTYAIAVPASAGGNTARQLGLINNEYSANTTWRQRDGTLVQAYRVSGSALYNLYRQNPSWFTLNESTNYISRVTGSKELQETISAAYLRLDAKFLSNRLRMTTGVRWEHTEDKGAGALNDPIRTYRRDANGAIVRDAQNRPVVVPGTALDIAKLQYVERGSKASRSYDGFYPSLNASYDLTKTLVARTAYARTIGRPSTSIIMPGVTVAAPTFDPGDPNPYTTLTVGNPGLRPWQSDSFDLSLEYYQSRGTTITVGVFHKKIRDFYALVIMDATPELLAGFGLPEEYINSELRTYQNFGMAEINGFEWSVRHQLLFLPVWARGVSVFANGTHLDLSGPNADDFTSFSRNNFNWGVSFVRSKFQAKVNVSMAREVKLARVVTSANVLPEMFRYIGPQTLVDVSMEYQFHKKISAFASARNLLQDDKNTLIMGSFTPDYARNSVTQRAGSLITVGLKGSF